MTTKARREDRGQLLALYKLVAAAPHGIARQPHEWAGSGRHPPNFNHQPEETECT